MQTLQITMLLTAMEVDPASNEFSIISLIAADGRCTTSPAAILLITDSSSLQMDGAAARDMVQTCFASCS
jgi:hypothetical protein